jgi:rod shape-determining protein MreD
MRRHVFAAVVLVLLALAEATVLPRLLIGVPRPNLVLVVACTWSALRTEEGFVWVLGGGLLLDLFTSAPFGTHTVGLMLGNIIAFVLGRFPLPAEFFRVTNWVAFATVTFHATQLVMLALDQRPFDGALALGSVILPLLVINPILSLAAYGILAPLQARLNEQERFARRV